MIRSQKRLERSSVTQGKNQDPVERQTSTATQDLWKAQFRGNFQHLLFAGIILMMTFTTPHFWSATNLVGLMNLVFPLFCLSLGMGIVMLGGELDLSVSSVGALGSLLLMVMLYGNWFLFIPAATAAAESELSGVWNPVLPPILVLISILGIGFLIGIANGALVSKAGIPSFVATLVMLYIVRGWALSTTGGIPYYGENGTGPLGILAGSIGLIPVSLLLFVVITGGLHYFMERTSVGKYIKAVGGSSETCRIFGVKVDSFLLIAFGLSGLLSALGGAWMTTFLQSGDGRIFSGYELNAIAVAVLGGVTFKGGEGSILGVAEGALTFALITDWLNLLYVNYYEELIIFGLFYLAIIVLQTVRKT